MAGSVDGVCAGFGMLRSGPPAAVHAVVTSHVHCAVIFLHLPLLYIVSLWPVAVDVLRRAQAAKRKEVVGLCVTSLFTFKFVAKMPSSSKSCSCASVSMSGCVGVVLRRCILCNLCTDVYSFGPFCIEARGKCFLGKICRWHEDWLIASQDKVPNERFHNAEC